MWSFFKGIQKASISLEPARDGVRQQRQSDWTQGPSFRAFPLIEASDLLWNTIGSGLLIRRQSKTAEPPQIAERDILTRVLAVAKLDNDLIRHVLISGFEIGTGGGKLRVCLQQQMEFIANFLPRAEINLAFRNFAHLEFTLPSYACRPGPHPGRYPNVWPPVRGRASGPS